MSDSMSPRDALKLLDEIASNVNGPRVLHVRAEKAVIALSVLVARDEKASEVKAVDETK